MLCSKSFPTPGDLKSHMYVHTGTWPFKCDVCKRGFSKQTNLKNHMQLHVSDKERLTTSNSAVYGGLTSPRLTDYLLNMEVSNNNTEDKMEENKTEENFTRVKNEIHKLFRPCNF